MTEILIVVLFAALAISFYAVWKSAWRSASPSPVPMAKRPYPHPRLGQSGDLADIAKSMQNTIFRGYSYDDE